MIIRFNKVFLSSRNTFDSSHMQLMRRNNRTLLQLQEKVRTNGSGRLSNQVIYAQQIKWGGKRRVRSIDPGHDACNVCKLSFAKVLLVVQRAIEEGIHLGETKPYGTIYIRHQQGKGGWSIQVEEGRNSGMKGSTKRRLDWREIGEVHLLNPFEK